MKNIFRLIHYWFPVVLGWSTVLVIQRATNKPILPAGICLYLLGILSAYSLDRWLDHSEKKLPNWLNGTLFGAFLISAILGVFIATQLSIQTFSVLILFSLIVIFYRHIKRIPLLKAILVAIVWTWAAIALPFQNSNWFGWQFWTMRISMPLVYLIAAGVVLCDFKDIGFDNKDGVGSLPLVFGSRKTIMVTSALLLIVAVISYQEGRIGLIASSLGLIGLAQFPLILSQDIIGPLLVDGILALPGFLIFLHLI